MQFCRAKRVLLLVLVAGVSSGFVVGQEDKWEEAIQAGKKAQYEGKMRDSEKFFKQANEEARKFAEKDVRRVAGLQGLAEVYRRTARGRDAEPLYVKALTILESVKGPEHPEVGLVLIDFARLYAYGGGGETAGSAARGPIANSTYAEMLPAGSAPAASSSGTSLIISQDIPRNFGKAETLYRRALVIFEKQGGAKDANYVAVSVELALQYRFAGKNAEAEEMSLRALEILRESPHATPLDTAIVKKNLAEVYGAQKKLEAAEQNYREAVVILEDEGMETLPVLATALEGYAKVLKEEGKKEEAKAAEKKAKVVREKIAKQKQSR